MAVRGVIREVSLAWEARLIEIFDGAFRKYVRVLHGPPSRERVGGKLPVVSVYLFDIHLTEYAKVTRRHEKKTDWTGDMRGLRLDYQFSAWTEDPLDEQLLLDHIRSNTDTNRTLIIYPNSKAKTTLSITPKPSLKFENVISFWSTMGWPPKVSLQYSVKAS